MIGICPSCKIRLKEPPFNGRETNEVMLTLKYRKMIEENLKIRNIDDLGYCELCNSTKKDIKEQKEKKS